MYSIGVDIGGTFTDCVIAENGSIVVEAKSASTTDDPSRGVLDVLAIGAAELGIGTEQLLNNTSLFIHGSTVATNAIVERRGAKVALLTSRGHEDTLAVGRIEQRVAGLPLSEIVDEYRLRKADPPLVERGWVIGVDERIDRDGLIVAPLDIDGAEVALRGIFEKGAESIAVCLLWSVMNPDHEKQLKSLIEDIRPGTYVAASSDIAPLIGEYERTVTTVLTAYLGPKVQTYLERLGGSLKELGFERDLLLIQATGGLTQAEGLTKSPLSFLDSGPVAGVLGGKYTANVYDEPNTILVDMGGTSFDVAIVDAGSVPVDEAPVIDRYKYLVPKVDVRSIGSGGGSKIWVGSNGTLRVGPESAGAEPGPACYDAGGDVPTVTDATLVLGILNPDYFLGGRKVLRPDLARDALERVGASLGMSAAEVAVGAFRIVNAQMADLIRSCTTERGLDTRRFALMAYGGAGATHAAYLSKELSISRVYIPHNASVFCGVGMLTTELLHTEQSSHVVRLPVSTQGIERFNQSMDNLVRRVHDQFARERVAEADVILVRTAYLKYTKQVHEVPVVLPFERLTAEAATSLAELFDTAYQKTYGVGASFGAASVEITRLRVEGRSEVGRTNLLPTVNAQTTSPAVPKGQRHVFIDHGAGIETKRELISIYDASKLQAGDVAEGPCVIERVQDTIAIPPWAKATLDSNRTICIDIELS